MGKTFNAKSTSEIKVVDSTFIGLAGPLIKEEDFAIALEEAKKEYPKARHYCSAYIYNEKKMADDDGEPNKTGGYPLLSILEGRGISQGYLIVVRYFGGTKLGPGRLSRSYKEAGLLAFEKAGLAELIDGLEITLSLDYKQHDFLKNTAKREEISLFDQKFEERITLKASGSVRIIETLIETFKDSILDIKKTQIRRSIEND